MKRRTYQPRRRRRDRTGGAVAEFALVAPFLVLILMGAIDVGQSINVAQLVNDASREGARRATRADVIDESEVEAAVKDYLAEVFPGVDGSDLVSSISVNVRDDIGSVSGGDLTTIESGDSVAVQVILDYDSVRWTTGFTGLTGSTIETTTVMRRE